jgi:hypothetical protein
MQDNFRVVHVNGDDAAALGAAAGAAAAGAAAVDAVTEPEAPEDCEDTNSCTQQ